MSSTKLFRKHFGEAAVVDLKHPNIEAFFEELNQECLEEDNKKTLRVVNPKYIIDVFRDKKTGSFYYNDVNNPDYYITNTSVGGIYILDILNNYLNLVPVEVNGKGMIPDDLFFYYSYVK